MQSDFKVLFYEDGDPIESRCIERSIRAFSKSYRMVVEKIIGRSEKLDQQTFGHNLAQLMPSFKMTRAGVFHGLKITREGKLSDRNHIVNLCWDQIGGDLQALKRYIETHASCSRGRVIIDLSANLREHLIEVSSTLFLKLLDVGVGDSFVGKVGATKVLFAAIPEIALPVDNLEWKHLFKTDRYDVILSTMAAEIARWENLTSKHLDSLSPAPTTLPSTYNVLAMAARDLTKANW